jgi:hypothetical protein
MDVERKDCDTTWIDPCVLHKVQSDETCSGDHWATGCNTILLVPPVSDCLHCWLRWHVQHCVKRCFSWLTELRHASCACSSSTQADDPRNLLHNSKLLDEYIGGGVVTQLSQATLLVLGLDPAPWVARGPHGLKQLCEAVVMGLDVARKLQAVMLRRCVCPCAITYHGRGAAICSCFLHTFVDRFICVCGGGGGCRGAMRSFIGD